MMHVRSTLLFISLAALAPGFAGCNDSEIRQYEVAKEKTRSGEEVIEPGSGGAQGPNAAQPTRSSAESEPQRMLAAIVPRQEGTWFFKLTGPPEDVAAQREALGSFLKSVRFDGSGPSGLGWDLPEGWHRVNSDSRMRVAALHVPGKEDGGHGSHMELTVVRLGPQAGGLEQNVNRWRRQIGLGPADDQALAESTETIEVAGTEATLVDITGPGGDGGGGMGGNAPFAGGGSSGGAAPAAPSPEDGGDSEPAGSTSESSGPLTYEVPADWEPNPGQSSMRVASFRVGEGDRMVDVSVIPLKGRAGGTLMNVNRWRRQIGLDPLDEQQLAEHVEPIKAEDLSGKLVDLRPSTDGGNAGGAERIIAAILPREDKTWFFKMRGPAGPVGEQREAFKRFVQSVRFETEDES